MTEGIRIAQPGYRITTERLELRCYALSDAHELRDALAESREDLLPWLPWVAEEPQDIDQKLQSLRRFRSEFDRGSSLGYGIFERGQPRLLGGVTLLRPSAPGAWELGYWLRTGSWGQGLATEASAALTRVSFEHYGMRRLEVLLEPANRRSRGIPERLGFRREGLRRQVLLPSPAEGSAWRDAEIWSLLAKEFAGSPSAERDVQAFDGLDRSL